jgi:DNA-binding XRE family transcriptional regulator
MREHKQRRLEAKGWKISDARDFLNLTAQEEVYIELRLTLAAGLKARRIEQHVTQIELATALGSSQSRVAKMEAGDPTVSIDLIVRALLQLGVSLRELAKIILSPALAHR